jgi:tripeptide aminopeptidase
MPSHGLPSAPSTTEQRVLDLAVQIQGIPAPTFEEHERAAFVQSLFDAERLQDVEIDSLHNVYARYPGNSRRNPLVVSAHLDTVFGADVPLGVSRRQARVSGPGIGDNSLGVAALFGLIWMLRQRHAPLAADLWLVANVREEGLGDLQGMRQVVARFGQRVLGYLVIEGTALGQVYHRAVGVRRYRVRINTSGGHSWSDYGQPSAVHELAQVITQITTLQLPDHPRTTVNVGMVKGGTGINVVASDALFDLDIRCETKVGLREIVARVESVLHSAQKKGVGVEVRVIGERPAGEIAADHRLVRLAGECLAEQGFAASFTSGSTDANIPLSLGLPALVLGVTTGSGAHTPHEYIDTPPISKGLQQLLRFVERAMEPRAPVQPKPH